MGRPAVVILAILTLSGISTLQAQRPDIGIAVGPSLVGGADSRALVDFGDGLTTGADLPGWHFRAFAQWPLASKLSFRTEVFGNWLSSGARTLALVQGRFVAPAQTDRTWGVLGTFLVAPFRIGPVTPHFVLGVGGFQSSLGVRVAPPEEGPGALRWRHGMGLGVQTELGLEIPLVVGSLWLEWRYAQALGGTRGVAFMPVTAGWSL